MKRIKNAFVALIWLFFVLPFAFLAVWAVVLFSCVAIVFRGLAQLSYKVMSGLIDHPSINVLQNLTRGVDK